MSGRPQGDRDHRALEIYHPRQEFPRRRKAPRRVGLPVRCSLFLENGAARRASRYEEQDESIKSASGVLNRPIAASLLLTLILSDLFYKNPPMVIGDLLLILILPAAARLAAGLLPRSLLRPLYGLLILAFIGILHQLIIQHGVFRRLVLMLYSMVALLAVLRMGWRGRNRQLLEWPNVYWWAVRLQ